MSSIVTAVFKVTIGLLVDKDRNNEAEKLKEGDVTDQKFRGLIIRKIDDIKSKLSGLSRKDLLASINFFEVGIELLYEVFDKARTRSEGGEVPVQADRAEVFTFAEEMPDVELSGLDESATKAFGNAKKRFEDARRKATRAFQNEALTTSDRILAMEYRVMATILETVDNPAEAMVPCRSCIRELNRLSAVQNSFNTQLKKGIKALSRALFSKKKRRKIISTVCHVNRVIFDVTQVIGKGDSFWMWPTVDTRSAKVDPLCDGRISKVLRKQGMEHCFLALLSFGQDGEESHRLIEPHGIATNSSGQFIIADGTAVKVFDQKGKFVDHVRLPVDDVHEVFLRIYDVTSDVNDNIYALAELYNTENGISNLSNVVCKFTYNEGMLYDHRFSVRKKSWHSWPGVAVDGRGNVLCRSDKEVDVYKNDGQFVRCFGDGVLEFALDLTCTSDGRVIVLDLFCGAHVFSENGDHIFKLKGCFGSKIAFHHSSEHVVVGVTGSNCLDVKIYTKDGELVRRNQILIQEGSLFASLFSLRGMTVTVEGRIVAAICPYIYCSNHDQKKVFIL